VGRGTSASGNEAVLWHAAGGMQPLGDLPGGSFSSEARAVSADGSVVVGRGATASGDRAFVWDATNGMQSLQAFLADAGVDLTGWQLVDATGISADGTTVAGIALNPSQLREAFVAVIAVPEPEASALALSALLGIGLVTYTRRRA